MGPAKLDEVSFKELAVDNTAYNLYKPRIGSVFRITGFIATGDNQIAANADSTVVIYEAVNDSTATVAKVLVQFVLTKSTTVTAIGLNIGVNEGVFINAKTDEDDVHLTLMGHFLAVND